VRAFGFCYVADCEPYVEEAMRSIASLRAQMPDVPVALVTRPELFRTDTPVSDWVELRERRKGPIVKADARLAPYRRVAFLDTDTLVVKDLTRLFALLDRFDFACAPEPNARPDYGIASGVPAAFLEPNSGFFLFRKTPEVLSFFDSWVAEYDALHEARGVTNDQPSLRIALWKSPAIRQLTLGSEYNLIPHTNSSVSGAVAVIHDRSPERVRLAAGVNRHLGPRAIVPGFGPVFGFITRRGWARQFARLTWRFLCVLLRPGSVKQQGHPVVWWRDGID
jgi:hypothetical protein